ncbi:MAG: hypothetical protein AAGF13_06520 [Pseudomonadota bacterium]
MSVVILACTLWIAALYYLRVWYTMILEKSSAKIARSAVAHKAAFSFWLIALLYAISLVILEGGFNGPSSMVGGLDLFDAIEIALLAAGSYALSRKARIIAFLLTIGAALLALVRTASIVVESSEIALPIELYAIAQFGLICLATTSWLWLSRPSRVIIS